MALSAVPCNHNLDTLPRKPLKRIPKKLMRMPWLILALVTGILASDLENGDIIIGPCPKECVCQGTSIDCSYRGLVVVPRDLPPATGRL